MIPKVVIIILNWNGWEDTIECLESLYQINYPNYNVIVVDNGSKNDSLKKIKEYCEGKIKIESNFFDYNPNKKPLNYIEYTKRESEAAKFEEKQIKNSNSNNKITIINSRKNYGFSEGNNIGIRYAMRVLNPHYILLLNNDTIVDHEFLDQMVKLGENKQDAGIIGPKTYYYNKPNLIQYSWFKINFWNGTIFFAGQEETDHGQYDETRQTDYVTGSCILIKEVVIKKIGLLDPTLFAYWEDVDYSMRARSAGYHCFYCPDAKIWHKLSQSTMKISEFRTYYGTRNMIWSIKKYAPKMQYILFILYFFIFRFWLINCSLIIYRRNINRSKAFNMGVLDGIR